MPMRSRGGRTQVDRAAVAAMTGVSASTMASWAGRRTVTGFPPPAVVTGRRQWYWHDQIVTFWRSYHQHRAGTYTRVDRRGHPDDLLSAPEAARVLGYRDHRSLSAVLRERPDVTERLPSGRLRRRWRRATVWAYADSRARRTSTGRPPGRTGPRRAHRYAGDPRLAAARALFAEAHATGRPTHGLGSVLAARLGVRPRTAQRLLATARSTSPANRRRARR